MGPVDSTRRFNATVIDFNIYPDANIYLDCAAGPSRSG